ncbi:Smr/MutS family protein [Oceanimonas sp. GK1]|uniref:endonuclease SmrB n=1 Tax=Oceanimonas sp. (strain GK1 / IBRC-M 10197) TaxID=511062 RepID=UPI000249538E|nr:endonuclease SmrB [Oceanimonas sp. GK1]AEY01924.1 Smr/MutS family protein [Oceanimonas sp. GK1]
MTASSSPEDDNTLFMEAMKGVRKLKQDTISPRRAPVKVKAIRATERKDRAEAHPFSDLYEPWLDQEGPTRFRADEASAFELKRLRRGDHVPELFLDLHGLTQEEAKQELSALLLAARRNNVHCVSIMHGHGKHILKQRLPMWLAQHPQVLAFHQATREWGGNAALLVLLKTVL